MAFFKETLKLRAFGLINIPLLFIVRPSILHISKARSEIKIPLSYWTRNHLKSMYFGALAIGADCAVGLIALHQIEAAHAKATLVFKDFKAEFIKRPEADVHFHCDAGADIATFTEKVLQTGERHSQTFPAYATTPNVSGNEPVARFELTLSLKKI